MQTFTIKTKPTSVNNRYIISRGKLILSEDYRAAKEAIAWEIQSQFRGEILTEDGLTVNIILHYKDNKRRDVDGCIKQLLDSMTGIVYKDDSQVDELNVTKIRESDKELVMIQVL